jgi:hypothetical protein
MTAAHNEPQGSIAQSGSTGRSGDWSGPSPLESTPAAPERATHLYTARRNSDTNEGRRQAGACPCLTLLVVFDDETFDGVIVRHLMCPGCASGWVREQP